MQYETQPPDVAFLRLPAVIAKVGLSKTEIYRRCKRGDFPMWRKRSHRVSVWLSHEIAAWQRAEMAGDEDLIG